jgi:hypothetical protein
MVIIYISNHFEIKKLILHKIKNMQSSLTNWGKTIKNTFFSTFVIKFKK